jgi:hypothetical protein
MIGALQEQGGDASDDSAVLLLLSVDVSSNTVFFKESIFAHALPVVETAPVVSFLPTEDIRHVVVPARAALSSLPPGSHVVL